MENSVIKSVSHVGRTTRDQNFFLRIEARAAEREWLSHCNILTDTAMVRADMADFLHISDFAWQQFAAFQIAENTWNFEAYAQAFFAIAGEVPEIAEKVGLYSDFLKTQRLDACCSQRHHRCEQQANGWGVVHLLQDAGLGSVSSEIHPGCV